MAPPEAVLSLMVIKRDFPFMSSIGIFNKERIITVYTRPNYTFRFSSLFGFQMAHVQKMFDNPLIELFIVTDAHFHYQSLFEVRERADLGGHLK